MLKSTVTGALHEMVASSNLASSSKSPETAMVLGLFFFARLRNFIEQHDKTKCGTVTVPHFFVPNGGNL
jgi:hypothetical protein